jgi:nucleotide-binding universal stress UspA family protein
MFDTVMLALSGSENAEPLVARAMELKSPDGRIVVVHVREVLAGRGAGSVNLDEPERLARVEKIAARLAGEGADTTLVRTSSLRGAASAIAELAARHEADVIVVGGGHRSRLLRAVSGAGTASALLGRVSCPVFAVSDETAHRTPIAA